jgi:hypothetical protein
MHFNQYFCKCPSVHFIHDVENSDDTISTTTCKLITAVAEINGEACSTEASDLGTWFEHVVCVEDLHFICTRTSRNNKITSVFLELGGIDETWLIRWKAFVPTDVLDVLTASKVPELELLVVLVGASEDEAIMEIYGVAADVWAINRSARTRLPDVPDFHILIPTS